MQRQHMHGKRISENCSSKTHKYSKLHKIISLKQSAPKTHAHISDTQTIQYVIYFAIAQYGMLPIKDNAKCKFNTSQRTKLLLITFKLCLKLRPNQENCRLNSLIVFIQKCWYSTFNTFAVKMIVEHLSLSAEKKNKHQVLAVYNFCLAQGTLFHPFRCRI